MPPIPIPSPEPTNKVFYAHIFTSQPIQAGGLVIQGLNENGEELNAIRWQGIAKYSNVSPHIDGINLDNVDKVPIRQTACLT
ncbi:hypothetical protein GCM10011375_40370 [Hymenobacter qilianensis]|uniref:Uncharacterized protein n=1 Tax=Hymenobacter qilianensis TaxID=1385715 RepID=A0ACB5PXA6_9BACT|nr:hypothetical protein GCM10011375_40370 [Hymenobacter qilianensis]